MGWTMTSKKSCRTNIIALLYVFLHVSPTLIGDTTAACVMPPTFGSFTGRPASTLSMMPMSDQNFVNELPAPFMSIEQTTTTTTTTTTSTTTTTTPRPITSAARRTPTLANCLWSFFRCNGSKCNQNWDNCMSAAMGSMNP